MGKLKDLRGSKGGNGAGVRPHRRQRPSARRAEGSTVQSRPWSAPLMALTRRTTARPMTMPPDSIFCDASTYKSIPVLAGMPRNPRPAGYHLLLLQEGAEVARRGSGTPRGRLGTLQAGRYNPSFRCARPPVRAGRPSDTPTTTVGAVGPIRLGNQAAATFRNATRTDRSTSAQPALN